MNFLVKVNNMIFGYDNETILRIHLIKNGTDGVEIFAKVQNSLVTKYEPVKISDFLDKIRPGVKVKSWDNDIRKGPHAHGIIGTIKRVGVTEVDGQPFDCPRYEIEVESYFSEVDGIEKAKKPYMVYPPVNGTKSWTGEVLNNVEVA